jgi:DNA-binding XRE family transcriptional regulator
MIRAARGLLGLDQSDLAKIVGVTRMTIVRVETDTRLKVDARRKDVLVAIQKTLEDEHGIEFIFSSDESGEGVRLRSDT